MTLTFLRLAVPVLYAVGALGYMLAFARNTDRLYNWVRPALVFGVLSHLLLFCALFLDRGHFPASTVFEGMVFSSLALSVFYFGMERAYREISYGAFLWPVNLLVAAGAVGMLGRGDALPRAMVSPYFVYHVTFFFLAYACFVFSFVVSIMYLLQYRAIASRRLGSFFHRLPALDVLDHSIMRADAIGLGLLLMGLALGYVWLEFAPGAGVKVPAKAAFAILTAGVYFSEHVLRNGKGWSGRRACYLSMLGFAMVLLTLVVGRHGY